MKIYSLLISGGSALEDGYNEFWNDLVETYDTLLKLQLQTSPEDDNNIFTFYANGQDYKYGTCSKYTPVRCDRTLEVQGLSRKRNSFTDYPANLESIRKVMRWLRTESFDMLIIWTFGHGFRHGRSSMLFVGGNTETLTDDEFTSLLKDISCDTRLVFMQQCFSGGFIDKIRLLKNPVKNGIIPDNIILTACEKSEFAYRADSIDNIKLKNKYCKAPDEFEIHVEGNYKYYHGEFNFHLNKALNQSNTIFPRSSNDTFKNLLEQKMENVFDYINKSHTTEESTQFLSPYKHKGIAPSPYKYNLKSEWSLGKANDDLNLQFYYDISLMFEEEENKTVIFKFNDQYIHTFSVADNTYNINERPKNKFGLNGKIIANYSTRQIFFEGYITNKAEDPYCPSQDGSYACFYPHMNSTNGLECNIVLFSWI